MYQQKIQVSQSTSQITVSQSTSQITVSKFNMVIQSQKEATILNFRQSIRTFENQISEVQISKPLRTFFQTNFIERTYSQCQLQLIDELFFKFQTISCRSFLKSEHYSDEKLSDVDYFTKYRKYIILCQSQYKGKLTRRKVEKLFKNHRYRKNVVKEIISTEEGYVNDLDLIINYIKPKFIGSKCVNSQQLQILFSNVAEIYQLNSKLLSLLQAESFDQPKYFYNIGRILLEAAPSFKMYFQFYNDSTKSQNLFKELKESNSDFNQLAKQLKLDPKLRSLGWEGFMVKPVQRLPKYELLLNDFIKHTEDNIFFKDIYKEALIQFKNACEYTNIKMQEYLQSIKMFELQKNYGTPNNLTILESTRKFLFEEKMSILYDLSEKNVLVFFLNDLILICEQDAKSEEGYHLIKHIYLSQKSYLLDIPNKRFFSNLVKVIGKNGLVTFICESINLKVKLMEKINGIITNLLKGNQSINNQIEVLVKGTEEREPNTFSAYTIYIIQVTINNIVNIIHLRYSELKAVNDLILKELPDLKIEFLSQSSWIGKKDMKIIENRILEIENFLLSLLVHEDFQNKSESKREKLLKMLKLDMNFFEFPNLSSTIMQMSQGKSKLLKSERIQSGQLIKSSIIESQLSQNDQIDGRKSQMKIMKSVKNALVFPIIVIFFDDQKIELQIPEWYSASEVSQEVAEQIQLKEICEFRLFECEENFEKQRLIMESELIINLIPEEYRKNQLQTYFTKKKKYLLFKKYIQLPDILEISSEQIFQDPIRIKLIAYQIFYEIKNEYFSFGLKDHSLFSALYLYINQEKEVQKELIKKIIPKNVYKSQKYPLWKIQIEVIQKQLGTNFLSFLNYELNIQGIQNKGDQINKKGFLEQQIQKIQQFSNQSMKYGKLLQELMKQHPFFGINFFQVSVTKNNSFTFQKYITDLKLINSNFFFGISHSGFHFIDEKQTQEFLFLNWEQYDHFYTYSDQIQIIIKEQALILQTLQGYQISSLVEQYEYLIQSIK